MSSTAPRTVPCPHCGEPVALDARSCWSCGSDKTTGWAPLEVQEGAAWEAPPEALDDEEYDDFLAREGLAEPGQPAAVKHFARTFGVAVVLILLALLFLLGGLL